MTDSDIVAELRQLYEAATGDDTRPWERIKKHDRVLGHPIYHGDPENEGVGVAFTLRAADLIVAMHNHLPALLDVVDEARNVRLYHSDPGMLKAMLYRLGEALAALERSDEG